MTLIPEKLLKQLNSLIENKFKTLYLKRVAHTSPNSSYYISPHGNRSVIDSTTSVCKFMEPMTLCDLFCSKQDTEQNELARLFDLEKKEGELVNLKNSIKHLKGVINET